MKDKIITLSFIILLTGFFLLNLIMKDNDISLTERRKLKQLPEITIESIISGDLFEDFNKYSLEQFPFRDEFRSLKSFITLNIFKEKDTNKLFIKDNHIYKLEYPVSDKSINNFNNKINNIIDKYLNNNNIYISIIPDKNYFLDDSYLKIDYDYLVNKVTNNVNALYIDIFKFLDINDYYKTDPHWKEDRIIDIAEVIAESMNASITNKFTSNTFNNFYGSYYGQLGLSVKSEDLTYLTNDVIDNATVKNFENDFDQVYNLDKINGMDPYDIYLSGATPFIEIENNNIKSDKELVIFRDSFGSSLAPLLLSGYKKVTLVDIRYIDTVNLEKLIKFNNQDVLFIYSTMLINNSETFKD